MMYKKDCQRYESKGSVMLQSYVFMNNLTVKLLRVVIEKADT